jgi:hypothetical protein
MEDEDDDVIAKHVAKKRYSATSDVVRVGIEVKTDFGEVFAETLVYSVPADNVDEFVQKIKTFFDTLEVV